MKISKILIIAAAGSLFAACAPKTSIVGTISNAPDSEIIVRQLNLNSYATLDTIRTDAAGRFSYKMEVAAGQPEFVYLFKGDRRIAGLLLKSGEKAQVEADTLGNYSVSGSEGSAKLAEVDKAYTEFSNAIYSARDNSSEMARIYLAHYRASVRYVMSNSKSLTVVPVLFETLGSTGSYVFNQSTDALIFRSAADSLLSVYPDSRYTKALDKEAQRRINVLELENMIATAPQMSFPDITLPDINGEKKSLSGVDSKVIMVHYWDARNAAQKIMNNDQLLPIYNDFHSRGFEIYSICVATDKAYWGSVVNTQKLPWINVCDGFGAASPAVATYGVSELPSSFLIINGELSTTPIKGADGLRKELRKILGQ